MGIALICQQVLLGMSDKSLGGADFLFSSWIFMCRRAFWVNILTVPVIRLIKVFVS